MGRPCWPDFFKLFTSSEMLGPRRMGLLLPAVMAAVVAAAVVEGKFWTLMGELERREKEEVERLGDSRLKGVANTELASSAAESTAAEDDRRRGARDDSEGEDLSRDEPG